MINIGCMAARPKIKLSSTSTSAAAAVAFKRYFLENICIKIIMKGSVKNKLLYN